MQIDIYGDEIVGKAYNTSLMRRLLKFFKPYQNQLALSLILLVAVSILQLSGPYLTKIAIDDHIVKDDWEGLSLIMIIYFALLLLSFILQYIQIYIIHCLLSDNLHDINLDILENKT